MVLYILFSPTPLTLANPLTEQRALTLELQAFKATADLSSALGLITSHGLSCTIISVALSRMLPSDRQYRQYTDVSVAQFKGSV